MPLRVKSTPTLITGGEKISWSKEAKWLGTMVTADCKLDKEISHRIQGAMASFKSLDKLIGHGSCRFLRSTLSRLLDRMVNSSLLNGAESWALSTSKTERLSVFHRSCLRRALPRRARERLSNEKLMRMFGADSIETQITRKHARHIGHIARLPNSRLPVAMSSAALTDAGIGRKGHHHPSLLGVSGPAGVYRAVISTHLTSTARRQFFHGKRERWETLAENRCEWKSFVHSISA